MSKELLSLIDQPVAAVRLRQHLKPAGGDGSKLFPPTFEGGVYCYETRRVGSETVPCVLMDSVASSANRHEEALAALAESGLIELPRIETDFDAFPDLGIVSTLRAPHRAFDAIFRDSELDGKPFNKHPIYTDLANANSQNATPLFARSPNSLLFGSWDSTGSAGGSGNKFARNLVTELVAINVVRGENRGGIRQDPLGITRNVEIEILKDGDWRPKGVAGSGDRAKGTRPSEVNHGNVLAKVEEERVQILTSQGLAEMRHSKRGGITCDHVLQTSVITLAGLRRLKFPVAGKRAAELDSAARSVLLALGLVAITSGREQGYALRSRCDLVADGLANFEILGQDGQATPLEFTLDAAIDLYKAAIARTIAVGLPWHAEPLRLKPQAKLNKLIELSRQAGGAE
jgi:CRISPR-associated protein Csb1